MNDTAKALASLSERIDGHVVTPDIPVSNARLAGDKGKIVCLPYSDPRDRRAKRLSIARRAATWGFRTEARYTDAELAVRRVDSQSPPAESKPRQRRRKA